MQDPFRFAQVKEQGATPAHKWWFPTARPQVDQLCFADLLFHFLQTSGILLNISQLCPPAHFAARPLKDCSLSGYP